MHKFIEDLESTYLVWLIYDKTNLLPNKNLFIFILNYIYLYLYLYILNWFYFTQEFFKWLDKKQNNWLWKEINYI
jgi:hypothetical protein